MSQMFHNCHKCVTTIPTITYYVSQLSHVCHNYHRCVIDVSHLSQVCSQPPNLGLQINVTHLAKKDAATDGFELQLLAGLKGPASPDAPTWSCIRGSMDGLEGAGLLGSLYSQPWRSGRTGPPPGTGRWLVNIWNERHMTWSHDSGGSDPGLYATHKHSNYLSLINSHWHLNNNIK